MKKSSDNRETIRNKIIGLGKNSIHKSYYPQLQQHIQELENQKKAIEAKNTELTEALQELSETEEQLRKSEKKFRTLFENTNDAILIHDSSLKFIDCNETTLKMFNCKRAEIINQTAEFLSPEFQPDGTSSKEASLYRMQLAFSGKPQTFEWVILDTKKTLIYSLISLNRFELEGEQYLQAIVRNITKTKKLEQELQTATIKAEEDERARFAKELHDGLGPVFSTVKLYFQWLSETNDPNKRKTIIEKGNRNIEQAIKTLREVSNNLSPHVLTNYGLIEGLRQFNERITETGKIDIRLNSTLKQRFEWELEVTLYRVITELINNTLKHASASLIQINIHPNGHSLKINYKDNGVGFDLKNRKEKDAGLGLYNIKKRIQNLGGLIIVKSKPGSGMEVNISLNWDYISNSDAQGFYPGTIKKPTTK